MNGLSTRFQFFAEMLQETRDRLYAVDAAGTDDEASRVWLRQREGLMVTTIAEPPITLADAIVVLAILSEWRDLLMGHGDEMSPRKRRDVDEMTTVALANCSTCMAGDPVNVRQHTDDHCETIGWLQRQTERWCPSMPGEAA